MSDPPSADPRIPRHELEARIIRQEQQIRAMEDERLRVHRQLVEANDRADALREKGRAVCVGARRSAQVIANAPPVATVDIALLDALRAEVERP